MSFFQARAEHLAVLRVVVFGLWFGLVLTTDTSLYGALPADMAEPRGLGRLLGVQFVLEHPAILSVLTLATLAGCALCVFGVRPFGLISGLTVVLILFHDVTMKSFGSYSNHAQSALLLIAVLLPFFPAADTGSVGKARPGGARWLYRTPLVGAASILCLTYSFIGARRLFLGGVGIYTDDSMLRWVVARTLEYGAHDLSVGLSLVSHRWVAPLLGIGLLVTTVFEILSPLAITHRGFRVPWLVVVALFHFSTLILMDIFFWENLVLLAVLFTPLGNTAAEGIGRFDALRVEAGGRVSP